MTEWLQRLCFTKQTRKRDLQATTAYNAAQRELERRRQQLEQTLNMQHLIEQMRGIQSDDERG